MTLDDALAACGIVAILRGVTAAEALAIGAALEDAGVRVVEVPLNSPDPFTSIGRLANAFAGRMVVGAGTVLDPSDINLLKTHGGAIAVSPDCNPAVIARAKEAGITPVPGVFTPTEAFVAVRAGAAHLKLFPAEAASPATVKAWRAVLPRHVKILAVGGVTAAGMQGWIDAGVNGFGIGSNIYRPGRAAPEVKALAAEFVAAWNNVRRSA